MPTMKDIAHAAGVSYGTVSNVINKTGKVSIQKIRLVEEAARKLGYIPNSQAQLLRQGASNHIAVIVPTLHDDRYRDLFLAVQAGFSQLEFEVSVHCTDDIAGNEEQILAALPRSSLAAIITVSCLQGTGCLAYESLICPIIAVDRVLDLKKAQVSFCGFDHYTAGRHIGMYILEQKWQRVAFFCSSGQQYDENDLLSGIKDALDKSTAFIAKFSSDTKLTINKAFDIIYEEHSFDGIVTTNCVRANAVMVAAKFLRKAKYPNLISIGTSQTFPNPFIETYEMDYGQMGAKIADFLQGYLQEKQPLPKTDVLPPKGFSFVFPHIQKDNNRYLHMLTLESPTTAALEKMLPNFHALTGITLKITNLPYNDLLSHMNLIGPKFSYDLIRMDVAWLSNLGRRIYRPLEDAAIAKDLLIRDFVSNMPGNYFFSHGVLCALPFDPSVQLFFYRSDLFNDATLSRLFYEKYRETLQVPQTMEEYFRISEFFTRSVNPDSPTEYGTAITSGSAQIAACDFLPHYLACGASICDEKGNARLDTAEMRAALIKYKNMKRFARTEESSWWSDSVRQFADGLTATVHTFSNHAAYVINSKRSNVVGKAGVAIMPGKHPLLGGGVLGICKHTQNIEACKQFFDWFYTRDIASAMVRLGGTSPLAQAYNSYENFSVFPWLSVQKESFAIGIRGSGHVSASHFSNHRYEYALGTAVRNVLNNTMSPDEAAYFAQMMYESEMQ